MFHVWKSPAKINLTLDILSKDHKSGYHEIQTIFQEIPLYDEIGVKELPEDKVTLEWRPLHHNLMNQHMGAALVFNQNEMLLDADAFSKPPHEKNTAVRAANLLKKKYGIKQGVHIKLKKNIPERSGLGGGSGNAATVLKALNSLWKLGLSNDELRELGKEMSMDTPFFIEGGTALGTHFGEKIEILPTLDIDVRLYHSGIEVESAKAYDEIMPNGKERTFQNERKFQNECGKRKKDTKKLVEIIKKEEMNMQNHEIRHEMFDLFHNDFELFVRSTFPRIEEGMLIMRKSGAKYVGITGSGGMIFGLYERH